MASEIFEWDFSFTKLYLIINITDYELATHPATGKIAAGGGKSMPQKLTLFVLRIHRLALWLGLI